MATTTAISWNRAWGLASTFGIPILSAGIWMIVTITRMEDKVNVMTDKQNKADARLDLLDNKLDRINSRLDTLAFHQKMTGMFQQRIIDGKRVFVPVN